MGFKVDAVDVLDYDFGPYVPEAKGTTPEPSTAKVQKYQRAVKGALMPIIDKAEEQQHEGSVTAADMRFVLSAERDEEGNAVLEAIIKATAEVCSNKPTKAQIEKLPWRVQQYFLGYIAGKFLSGEALTPATTP